VYRLFALLAFAGLAVTVVAPPARAAAVPAADLLDAKVDYTADYYITSAKGSYRGTVIHAPGRERREFDSAGVRQVLLLRRDIDLAAMIWPERKWYVRSTFGSAASLVGGFDGISFERKASGGEIVGGEPTTRYDVTAAGGQGGSFHGRMWFTKDGILMKVSGQATFIGRQITVETGLLNLRRVKADPAAFVLPADYVGVPLDFSKLGIK
jgi:hypothetical protein